MTLLICLFIIVVFGALLHWWTLTWILCAAVLGLAVYFLVTAKDH